MFLSSGLLRAAHLALGICLLAESSTWSQTKEDDATISLTLDLAKTFQRAGIMAIDGEYEDGGVGSFGMAAGSYQQALDRAEKAYGPKHLVVSDILAQMGEMYVQAGFHAKAEPLITRAIAIRTPQIPADHIALSTNWRDLGVIYLTKKDYAKAEEYFNYSLKVRESKKNNYLSAESSADMGRLYQTQGLYAKAEPFYVKAVKYREEVAKDKENQDLAKALNQLGVQYKYMGRYAEAVPPLQRSLKIYNQEKDSGNSALVMFNLSNAYYHLAKYEEAETLGKEALALRKKRFGEDHLRVADSLNDLGLIYMKQNRFAEALDMFQQSAKLTEAKRGPEDTELATTLNNLALAWQNLGRPAEAEALLKRSIKIQETKKGTDHPEVAYSLNNLAQLYVMVGRHAEAEPVYLRALGIQEQKLGAKHPQLAETLSNFAGMQTQLGQYDKAEALYQRALKIQIATYGNEHPTVATTINNLGSLSIQKYQGNQAEDYLRQSLEMRQKLYGGGPNQDAEHLDVAASLANLGSHYNEAGEYAKAEQYLRRSLKIYDKLMGDQPQVALIINNLALACTLQSRTDEGLPLYERSFKILEKAGHPDLVIAASNLATLYGAKQRWPDAVKTMDACARSLRRHVSTVLPILAEQEQLTFLRRRHDTSFQVALSLGLARAQEEETAAKSASWMINGKGVAHQALAERSLLGRDSGDAKQAPAIEELLSLRRQLANLTFNATPTGQAEKQRQQISQLTLREQALAKQLGQAGSRPTRNNPWVELAEVRSALPKNTVFVDIARFKQSDWSDTTGNAKMLPPRYAAWLVPAEGLVRVIDLGPADAVEAAVKDVRHAFEGAGKQIQSEGEKESEQKISLPLTTLAKLVLHPLLPHIEKTERWIISPDASLWLAPWAALPLPDGAYAIEKHPLSYVVSGRDLVTPVSATQTNAPVIVADPTYDLGAGTTSKTGAVPDSERGAGQPKATAGSVASTTTSKLPKVAPLPATAIEARLIQPQLQTYVKTDVPIIEGDKAVENVVKEARRPRVMVLSTHGFFLPDQEAAPEKRSSGQNQATRVVTQDGQLVENPLLRCGLLFAGCNQSGSGGGEDGILTGLEIVSADLRGTELVVLSACETGLGDVRNGEGVAGLRQAFQLAGAQAVVASLWQVPDRETARLMNGFFTAISAGTPKAESLRQAQLNLIKQRREKNDAAHPFYWAAFTLTGVADFLPVTEPEPQPTALALFERGRALDQKKEYPAALAAFTEALKLEPENLDALVARGWVQFRLKKDAEAVVDFTEAIRVNPKSTSAFIGRSVVHRFSNAFDKAIADATQAVQLDGKSATAFGMRGAAYLGTKEYDKAIPDLTHAVELDPKYRFAWGLLGDSQENLKAYDKAIAAYTQALQVDAPDATLLNKRGLAQTALKKYDLSIADYTEAITADATFYPAFANRGIALRLKGETEKALADFSEAIRLNPKYTFALNRRGLAYHDLGKHDSAISDFTEALVHSPKSAVILGNRGLSHERAGDAAKALADYTDSLSIDDKDPWTWHRRGTVRGEQKQWEQAVADLSKAIELKPSDIFYWTQRAQMQLRADDQTGYRQACQAIVDKFGETKDTETANSVAWVCAIVPNALPDYERIVSVATFAASTKPPQYGPLGTLGAVQYRNGKFNEALQSLTEAVKLEGKGGMVEDRFFLAMTHQKAGHAADAREWLDKAVQWLDQNATEKAPVSGSRKAGLLLLRAEAEKLIKEGK